MLRTRLVENHHYLFQMCVTFKCRERFMVTHQDTQVRLSVLVVAIAWVVDSPDLNEVHGHTPGHTGTPISAFAEPTWLHASSSIPYFHSEMRQLILIHTLLLSFRNEAAETPCTKQPHNLFSHLFHPTPVPCGGASIHRRCFRAAVRSTTGCTAWCSRWTSTRGRSSPPTSASSTSTTCSAATSESHRVTHTERPAESCPQRDHA